MICLWPIVENFLLKILFHVRLNFGKISRFATVCFTDLDHVSKMIIFESILFTFIAKVVFRGGWGSKKNWLELKIIQL